MTLLALALLGACTPRADTAVDCDVAVVTATLADVPTVVRVTWETPTETTGYVHFTTPAGPVATPPSTGTRHEALLVGNRAASAVDFDVVVGDDTCAGTITTGELFAGLPDVTLTGSAADGPAYTIVPVLQADASGLAVLDAEGEYVWAWSEDRGEKTTSFFGAELALDRTAILANVQAEAADEPGYIYRIGLDGTLLAPIQAPGAHTDFVQLPDGAVATLGWEVREVDGRKLLGDTVVEIAPDGGTRTVWNVFDWFIPDTNRAWQQGWYPADPEVEDWSHVNGLAHDPDGDGFLLTTTFDQSVLRVDRATGEIDWRLADEGDFANPDGADLVDFPHSVQAVDGGVLVFNRGDIHDPESCSRATGITLDGDTARATWTYTSERCLLVPFLGSATRRDDGVTLVDWTTSGQLDAVEPDGALAWRLNLDLGAAFAFADYVDTFY